MRTTTAAPTGLRSLDRRVAVIALTVMTVDQVTKAVAVVLATGSRSGVLLPVRNTRLGLGVAGMSIPTMALLAAIGIVTFGVVGLRRARAGLLPAWVPGFLVGGAASNLLDRLASGGVHDLLATPWLIANVADLAIVAGLIGWIASDLTRSTPLSVRH
jgi:lipoprotein signal peptidase